MPVLLTKSYLLEKHGIEERPNPSVIMHVPRAGYISTSEGWHSNRFVPNPPAALLHAAGRYPFSKTQYN